MDASGPLHHADSQRFLNPLAVKNTADEEKANQRRRRHLSESVFRRPLGVDGKTYIKINDGYTVDRDEPKGFVKVGHISDVVNKEFSDFEAVDHEDDNAQ